MSIVRKYSDFIDVLISESDQGQYYAINKGLEMASGEIVCWLNADDMFMPWTLKAVKTAFELDTCINWITGMPSFIDDNDILTHFSDMLNAKPRKWISRGYFNETNFGYLQQESMFWRRSVMEKIGSLDVSYALAADFDYWMRMSEHYTLYSMSIPLASFRIHSNQRSKILKSKYRQEVTQIRRGKSMSAEKLISFKGIIWSLRYLFWARSPFIHYSKASGSWIISRYWRPAANVTFFRGLIENK